MHCPFCREQDTKVVDSRLVNDGDAVRRRRACSRCGERFNTFEYPELSMPKLIKRDGSREVFDERKLLAGFVKALEKRPVGEEEIEASISNIKYALRSQGDREVPALSLGELVMDELKLLDPVAYVRFASVYRDFQDVKDFADVVEKLE